MAFVTLNFISYLTADLLVPASDQIFSEAIVRRGTTRRDLALFFFMSKFLAVYRGKYF